MLGLGHLPEIFIILVIALLVFGPRRVIEMGSSMGKAFREFRESVKDIPGMGNVANLGGILRDDEPQSVPFSSASQYPPSVSADRAETTVAASPAAAPMNGPAPAASAAAAPAGSNGSGVVEGTVERVEQHSED
jgi:sec-independent protein translocase protein TatA